MQSPATCVAEELSAQLSGIGLSHKSVIAEASGSFRALNEMAKVAKGVISSNSLASIAAAQGSIRSYERQIAQAALPLRDLLDQVERQQRQFANLMAHMQPPAWTEFATAAEAIRRSLVLQTGSGNFAFAGDEAAFEFAHAVNELVIPPDLPDTVTISAILSVIMAAIRQVLANTPTEAHSIGPIGASGWLASIVGLMLALTATPGLTPEQHSELRATRQAAEELDEHLRAIAEAEAQEQAYVSSLRKAVVIGGARVRVTPAGSGAMVTRLPAETVVGIAERRGRWRRAVYRDTLTVALQEGWVYEKSLRDLVDDDLRAGPTKP
jgi:hypothetical protein